MKEFTYENLNSHVLSSSLRANESVLVKLSRKRAKLAMELLFSLNRLMGNGKQKESFLSISILFVKYFYLLLRITIFHRKLFRLFIFYFNNSIDFLSEKQTQDEETIKYFIM